MKGSVIILFMLCGLFQTIIKIPPEAVAKAFKQKFPSAINIKWKMEKSVHEEIIFNPKGKMPSLVKKSSNFWYVSFNLKEKEILACYTEDGHWISSRMKLTILELRDEVNQE